MKLRFVWVGKTKEAAIRDLVRRYLDRVGRFAGVEVSELRGRSDVGDDPRSIIESEGSKILQQVASDPCVVVLDERGSELDSIEFSEFIERHRVGGTRRMTFVIGSHNGLSDEVRRRAEFVLALSRMTLTHELSRVFLLEQVYRAFAIIHDLPYQK